MFDETMRATSSAEPTLSSRSRVRPVVFVVLLLFGRNAFSVTNEIQFNRDVRPILSENCFACHGHDKNQRKAKLRLDVRDVALERGAIVPGKPDESKLVEHVFSTDPDEIMPPPKSNKKLTAEQKELLKKWIASGADYEPHWAYIPPKRFPTPRTRDSHWVRNPIDAFILNSLEAKDIRPSPEADKRTLLRRLSLDLIGLPPTVPEIEAFLADNRPNAYERQVERLMSSPRFGERMAVPWLDVVRFSDTVGYHGDQNQNVFPYRDYVIDAFNKNKPFDQFTVEQLAGDLLTNATTEDLVASGFNRLNMMTREGGAQAKEYLAKYAGDRVRTVSMAWLGSTMGCAECHDHKYDPFTSKDFYSMEAFFADLKQWGVYMDYGYTPNPDLKGFSNDHPFPPEILLDSPYLHRRLERLSKEQSALLASIESGPGKAQRQAWEPQFKAWTRQSEAFLKQWPSGWAMPLPSVTLKLKDTNAVAKTNFTIEPDATIAFKAGTREKVSVSLPLSNTWVAAVRFEIVPQEEKEDKHMGRKKRSETELAPKISLKKKDGKNIKLAFYFGDADHKEQRYSNGAQVLGVTDMWKISTEAEKQTAVWLLDKPAKAEPGDMLEIDLGAAAIAAARVSVTPFASAEPLASGADEPVRKSFEQTGWRRTREQRAMLNRAFLFGTHWDTNAMATLRRLETEIRLCRGGKAFTMVSASREPAVTRILARGNWQDETGEIVQPEVPHFLPQIAGAENRRLNRLDLARWLVSGENPLTARAVMNRLWKQFFGTGISAVVDDLGAQGEWPVHPELLDWLAREFMQPECNAAGAAEQPHPWDFKHMVRLLVMSSTYRQSSNQRPELKEIDPNNRLLACQSPRRLDAEFVRDNALEISGLLNDEIGGPSAHPYQPAGYYANIQFPDRDYYPEKDERQYRRGVYTHWQRTFLHPMLANFDAPSREECVANRIVSNTPQQALTLLNDPSFVEAARVLAARALGGEARTDEQRLNWLFQRALARAPRDKERLSLEKFLANQREHYAGDMEGAAKLTHIGLAPVTSKAATPELAVWTQICRVILNLHETITVY
jgi:hypothetical protein